MKYIFNEEEIKFIENMKYKALKAFIHHEMPSYYFVLASSILDHVATQDKSENSNAHWFYEMSVLLDGLSRAPAFNDDEKMEVAALSSRCATYGNSMRDESVPTLSEQEKFGGGLKISDENRIAGLRAHRDTLLTLNDNDFSMNLSKITSPVQAENRLLQRKAYYEGKKGLTKKSLRALNEAMRKTAADPYHNEYFATGISNNDWVSAVQKGFIKDSGLKSVNPVYNRGEDKSFHSHPDLGPLSLNGSSFLGDKYRGDLAHSMETGKKIYVINSRGDIFYTNPELSGHCIVKLKRCTASDGQVFLGNIKEFR